MANRVGGITNLVTASVTRPNDTTAYSIGDQITDSTSAPTVLTFLNAALKEGDTGVILGAILVDSANQTTKLDADLFIFDTTYTPDNDNAAFTPTDAEMETCVGVITFSGASARIGDATSGASGNCSIPGLVSTNLPFKCGDTTRSLYGALVARSAYTPVAQEKFTIRLRILQD